MRRILVCLPLLPALGCAEPAILRQGPGSASMERTEAVPLPRLVEPTGQGRISLTDPGADEPQAFRMLRSDPARR